MDILTILIIAIGLSMDAFSVSIALSLKFCQMTYKQSLRICFFFGFFQFIMPVIGFYAGSYFQNIVRTFDHWVAFSLLCAVGIKMFIDSFKKEDEDDESEKDPTKGWMIIVLSVATSIDAVAVGFSFAMLRTSIILPSIIIGVICFILSFLGSLAGRKLGKSSSKWVERFGGIVLIIIGMKIVFDHIK